MFTELKLEEDNTEVYSDVQAKYEAARCLYCYDAPCKNSCPANVDVPTFIRRIAEEDYSGAIKAIKKTNIFPAVCAVVCPQEVLCEGACVRSSIKEPIAIGKLQHFAASKEKTPDYYDVFENEIDEKRKEKIAVIGGGPAGLSAALELKKAGFNVVVLEKQPELGGVLRYGIPSYRLPDEVFIKEINNIVDFGVEIKTNQKIGTDYTLEKLKTEYDAVLITAGLTEPSQLNIEGIELKNSIDAWTFLEKIKTGELKEIKGEVIVAGGGNVAVDAALTAKYLGAEKVTVSYRRTKKEMPAWEREVQTAVQNGIRFLMLTNPYKIEGNSIVQKILFHKMERLDEKDSSGRNKVKTLEHENFVLDADWFIYAVGQKLQNELASELPNTLIENNLVQTDENFRTSIKGIYAAGDCVNGGDTVVRAAAEGKKAAQSIIHDLRGEK